jgi:hypothetical protein
MDGQDIRHASASYEFLGVAQFEIETSAIKSFDQFLSQVLRRNQATIDVYLGAGALRITDFDQLVDSWLLAWL